MLYFYLSDKLYSHRIRSNSFLNQFIVKLLDKHFLDLLFHVFADSEYNGLKTFHFLCSFLAELVDSLHLLSLSS